MRGWAYTIKLDPSQEYMAGSSNKCSIQLAPGKGGSQHAIIKWQDGRWILKDLGAPEGTFVNNHRVKESALKHGEAIRMGGCDIVFQNPDELTGNEEQWTRTRRNIAEREYALREVLNDPDVNTIQIEGIMDVALGSNALPGKAASPHSSALNVGKAVKKELNSKDLLWVAQKLASTLSEALNQSGRDQIYELMLQRLKDAIEADNGFIMIPNPETKRWLIRAWTGDPSSWTSFGKTHPVPLTVANRAYEKTKVVSNAMEGLDDEEEMSPSKSMLLLNVNSYIAVPLVDGKQRLGVVYFDTRNPAKEFLPRDVKLLERAGSYIVEIENQHA
jgi:hypothetical protein